MATCPDCGQEISNSSSVACTKRHFTMGNKLIPRIPYGEERRPALEYAFEENCDDCGAPTGGIHHRDCTIEQCPICGDYAAVCYCWGHLRKAPANR